MLATATLTTISGSAIRCGLIAAACCLVLAEHCSGQQGYGSYYGQTVKQTHGQIGTQSTSRYLYDQHFYKRSTVSPYINLDRMDTVKQHGLPGVRSPGAGASAADDGGPKCLHRLPQKEGRVGDTRFPGATYGGGGTAIMKPVPQRKSTPSAYYNHWYGGWQNR